MIKVIVVDDQTLIRQGIGNLLSMSEKVEVVADANDGESALYVIEQLRPDVILMDVRMPGMNGIDVLRKLRSEGNTTPIILLTTFEDQDNLQLAMRHGANGYLLKDVSLDGLISSIELVLEGQSVYDIRLNSERINQIQDGKIEHANFAETYELTTREVHILELLGEGASNKEIATKLDLKMGTVKNYVSSILLKLDVRDRTQAVIKVKEEGGL